MTRCDRRRVLTALPWMALAPSHALPTLVRALGSGHRASAGMAASAVLAVSAAHAQAGPPPGHRRFNADAIRGTLAFGEAPGVTFNGVAERLAPGARIRGADGLLRLPASLQGQRLTVHAARERATGLLRDVWILNEVELANQPWPRSLDEARQGTFDAATQRWTLP
jgi:hypothetical protein